MKIITDWAKNRHLRKAGTPEKAGGGDGVFRNVTKLARRAWILSTDCDRCVNLLCVMDGWRDQL